MEINEYLIKFIQTIKSVEEVDLFAASAKLSRTEFRMIREILIEREKGKEIISSELARRLGITRSAVSQLVTKMEKEGIVKRTSAPDDKKIAYVQLSERSLAVFEEQCRLANEIMERVVELLGEEKVKNLISAYDEFCRTVCAVRREQAEKMEK